MTPLGPDRDTVVRRLRMIERALDQLRALRGADEARLEAEPLTRAAAERLLQVVVDLAFDVNGHIAASTLGRAPESGRASFFDLATAGVLDDDLARKLAPSAGLRNVLVHHYLEVRLDVVAGAISDALDQYPAYVTAVGRFLREAGERMATDGSDPQVEVVRRAYRLFGARRVDDLLAMMTDDVEWPDVANAAVLHGRDAIRPYWEAQFAQADPRVELIEVRESGDDLVAVVDQCVLGHDGQVLVPSTVVHHRYTFRGNLVRRMVVLTDPVSTSSSA